jgi:DNA-binding HxlR family transcriptional regulator
MSKRQYDQHCSLAQALDHIGERWSLLIIRELFLGPLRFSDLARSVGGPPTDVLTKRLRALEQSGIIRRRELTAPASGSAYELTELGRELEPALVALGRWGLNFLSVSDAAALDPSTLANALRVILQPPADVSLVLQIDSGDQSYRLGIGDGSISAERGAADAPDLILAGAPGEILLTLAVPEIELDGVEIQGDAALLTTLQRMVVLPERLQDEVRAAASTAPLG